MPTLLCLPEALDQIVRKGSEEERRGGEELWLLNRRWGQALGAGAGRPNSIPGSQTEPAQHPLHFTHVREAGFITAPVFKLKKLKLRKGSVTMPSHSREVQQLGIGPVGVSVCLGHLYKYHWIPFLTCPRPPAPGPPPLAPCPFKL